VNDYLFNYGKGHKGSEEYSEQRYYKVLGTARKTEQAHSKVL